MRQEIEAVRGDLSGTLEAIGDRVSPKRVAQRRVRKARSGIRSMREAVMGKTEDVKETVSASAVGGALSGGVESMKEAGGTVKEAAGDMIDHAKSAPQALRRQAEGNPLAAGLIAFGAGLLAASILPESELEHRLTEGLKQRSEPIREEVMEAVDTVKGELQDNAKEALEQVKHTAGEAVEQVKNEAQERVEEVKSQASGAAQDLKDDARDKVADVREQAVAKH